jgi:hypothetical protein
MLFVFEALALGDRVSRANTANIINMNGLPMPAKLILHSVFTAHQLTKGRALVY